MIPDDSKTLTGKYAFMTPPPPPPPRDLLLKPVTWNPPNTSRPTSTYMSTVPCGAKIITSSKRSAATSIARPLPRIICCCNPHHRHRKFCTFQPFQINSTQGFWQYPTQVFPTWFEPRFSTGFDSVSPTRFDSRFLTGSNSGFSGSIWLMFNVFIFSSSHIIWVTFQSGLRSPILARVS